MLINIKCTNTYLCCCSINTGLVCLFVTNFAACTMYFLARLENFNDNTWLGPLVSELNGPERYIISLYWSVVTFTTVGYAKLFGILIV